MRSVVNAAFSTRVSPVARVTFTAYVGARCCNDHAGIRSRSGMAEGRGGAAAGGGAAEGRTGMATSRSRGESGGSVACANESSARDAADHLDRPGQAWGDIPAVLGA